MGFMKTEYAALKLPKMHECIGHVLGETKRHLTTFTVAMLTVSTPLAADDSTGSTATSSQLAENTPKAFAYFPQPRIRIQQPGRLTKFTGDIHGFSINQTTGFLSSVPGSPTASGWDARDLVFSPNGKFGYIVADNYIYGYSVNADTGRLTAMMVSPFYVGGRSGNDVHITPSGQHLLTSNFLSSSISVFSISDTGGLTAATGSPFDTGILQAYQRGLIIDPSGQYVYVFGMVETADKTSVWKLFGYSLDSKTGTLKAITGMPIAMMGRRMTFGATGNYAYVENNSKTPSYVLSLNAETGLLSKLPASNGEFDMGTRGFTLTPLGNFAYALDQNNSDTLMIFSVDPFTGKIKKIFTKPTEASKVGYNPNYITLNEAGTLMYVPDTQGNNVYGFSVNQATGALTKVAGSPFSAGDYPMRFTISPSGKYGYVTNAGHATRSNPTVASTVSGYSINAKTGVLTSLTGSPFAINGGKYGITMYPNN